MTDIQRTCPGCQATLELPADSVGKQAQCPACQNVFVVPAAATPDAPWSAASSSEFLAKPTVEPAGTRPYGHDDSNPYAPGLRQDAPAAPVARPLTDIVIRTASPEQYINTSWLLFQQSWKTLCGAGAVLVGLNLISLVIQLICNVAAQESGNGVFQLVGMLLRGPIFLLIFFASLGTTRMCLDLARGLPIHFGQTFATPMIIFLKTIAGTLLLYSPLLLFGVPVLLAAVVTQGDGGAIVLTLIPMLLFFTITFILIALFTWPWKYLLIDRQMGLRSAIRTAYQVARVNKVNALLLYLLAMGLGTAGACMCYVGQVATLPLTILLFCVAVLMMTGQAVVSPQPTPQPTTTPPLGPRPSGAGPSSSGPSSSGPGSDDQSGAGPQT